MNTNEKIFELLENTGLNWSVEKSELFDSKERSSGMYGMYRKDNDYCLGVVGDQYEILQNFELAEIIIEAANGLNFDVTNGGSLKDGRRVYLQIALPDEKIGKSPVKRWISALNSHDGSLSVGFGSTNTTVICQNTFYRAHGDLQKFRHTATMKERISIAQKGMRKTLELDNELMENFKRMADMPLRDEAIERVINKIFKVDVNKTEDEISTRKRNQIESFANSLNTSITEQGRTIWALFNGVTRYTNHENKPKDENKKTDHIMSGNGNVISNVGFTEIMKFVESNTAKQFAIS